MLLTCLKIIILLMIILTALCGCAFRAADFSYAPDIHVSLGVTYLQQGNLEKARMALNQALLNQPHEPAGWGAMGYLEEISGNLRLAEIDYQQAIQLAPRLGDGHNNYGIFLCRHGQPRAGIKELLIAAQTSSYVYRAAAFQNAGLCALKIPDPPAAQQYFKKAQQNDPQKKLKWL